LFQQFFWPWIIANLSIDLIVSLLEILTVVSTIFCPSIKANVFIDPIVHFIENLTVVSTVFSRGIKPIYQ